MSQYERAVDVVEDVELEHVAAELDRELEGTQCVLGRQRRRTTVADASEFARRPA
jgi:hypothetical protein